MSIYRGAGGSGDATNDATVSQVQTYASQAATSATNAASSATAAAASASGASTSAALATSAKNDSQAIATTVAGYVASALASEAAASDSATDAAASASAAAISEGGASGSASDALDSANTATTQATAASTSATNSANSAASALAIYGNTTAMNTAVTNAGNSATSAATSATNAATSASDAAGSASNAATSASAASGSVTAAATSAANANTSASSAASSASSASGSATIATTQASNASTSAAAASNSATNAATSAITATTQAGIATTGATTATTQAGVATTQAGIATTQATSATSSAITATTQAFNASTSATNAASSETNSLANRNAAATSATNASNSASASATSATSSATSASAAATSAAAASAVALGNEPVRHSVRPSLLLDFANTKQLDPRITFTRASTATFYDGRTTAKAEENLALYSQQFTNAYWTNTDNIATITDNNTTAPDGTTTAAIFIENSSASVAHGVRINNPTTIVSGSPYTASVYLKAGTRQFASLLIFDGANYNGIVADLSGGTITLTTGTLTSSSITSVGSGWYRLTITKTLSASTYVGVFLSDSGTPTLSIGRPAYTGNGTGSVYAWGAQLEQRSSVTTYTPTTTAPITNYIPALQTAASGVARFDHNPTTGESLGLLIEEQRVNLVTRSEELNNATWNPTAVTVTTNVAIAPNGTQTANLMVPNTTSTQHYVLQFGLTTGAAYTFSCYMKFAGVQYGNIFGTQSGNNGAMFDLVNGTVFSVTGTGNSASITSVGNGWYRCVLTQTASSVSYTRIGTDSPSVASIGNGWAGILIWGAQTEAGAFATSYIPTVASQVTRPADAASMTGTNFSSWYRADEGTLYSSFVPVGTIANNIRVLELSNGTSNRVVDMYFSGSRVTTYNGTTTFSTAVGATVALNTEYKVAGVYKSSDYAIAGNGTTPTAATSTLVNIATNLYLGRFNDGSNVLNGTIKKLAYYPKRLTNAELQGLTTV